MRKILGNSMVFLLLLAFGRAYAKEVILDNQLDNEYLVITELYKMGIESFIPSVPLIVPPRTKQSPYVIKHSTKDNYLYEVKVSVTKNPADLNGAMLICKASYGARKNYWRYFNSLGYKCIEDVSIYDPDSGYNLDDPDDLPFTIIVKKESNQ